MIYFDNAATSWPKPDSVIDAMIGFIKDVGANPGRSGHRLSVEAERIRMETREILAHLFNASDPMKVIFTPNVTYGINLVIMGYINNGDRVITTSIEHNSVMRPLRYLEEKRGVDIVMVKNAPDGTMDIADMKSAIDQGAKLVIANHASNVSGTILPIREIGEMAKDKGIPMMVDTAQTAGCLPINMERDNIDILAFTGHKSLLGPTGTGGVIFDSDFDWEEISPLCLGGTGSRSQEEYQPDFLPDRFESGTANIAGISGLLAGVSWIIERGVDKIRAHEVAITRRLIEGLMDIPGVTISGPRDASLQTATVSFVIDGISNSDVGMRLDNDFDLMCRVGLHCAPRAHMTLGTFPNGTVRFGMGPFTTTDDVDRGLMAVTTIAKG